LKPFDPAFKIADVFLCESDIYDTADAPLRYPRGRSGW